MRDARRTTDNILAAARRILARQGFAGLGVNALAAEAAVGKPLIYRYFGNMEGVASALVAGSRAAGGRQENNQPEGVALAAAGGGAVSHPAGPEEAIDALIRYGRALAGDRTRRDLLAWSLAAAGGPALEAEKDETPVSIAGPNTGPTSGSVSGSEPGIDRAAIMAILQAATAFLLVCGDRHGAWAGMPLSAPRHLARLERALAAIIEATFSETQVTNR